MKVASTTLATIFLPVIMNSDHDTDLQTRPREWPGGPACQISRPKVISFKIHTDRQTHMPNQLL